MGSKSKFQISRSLDERITRIFESNTDSESYSEFNQETRANILGFHSGNVTNFVGLTTDYKLYNAGFPVVGLVYFKSAPTEVDVKADLTLVQDYSNSSAGLGKFKSDQNDHLFLIYILDEDSKKNTKKIYDYSQAKFLIDQPNLSVLDDAKIYSHSALVKVQLTIKLNDIVEGKPAKFSLSDDEITDKLDEVKKNFSGDSKGVKIYLNNSNWSSGTRVQNKDCVETIYDYLNAPKEVEHQGDYLPQLSKKDKLTMVNKWRNREKSSRSPLEFKVEHEDFSVEESDDLPDAYNLHVEVYSYLCVNDPISKSMMLILFLLRNELDLVKVALRGRTNGRSILEPGELKSCTFKPRTVGHFIQSFYDLPSADKPDFKQLCEIRRKIHQAYLLPSDAPQFRYSQRILNSSLKNRDELAGYLCNTHASIADKSGIQGGLRNIIGGTYTYHHYTQDRANDTGWGCAYRSLQTLVSWFKHQGYIYSPDIEIPQESQEKKFPKIDVLRRKLWEESRVPTHEEIQSVLVDVGDKQESFIGSQKWIGSQEVYYVLNHLYNLDCKFISVNGGGELVYKARELSLHLAHESTPIMIGGGLLAHTIIGVDFNEKNGDISYLILDPHYTGEEDVNIITKKGWCGWKKNAFWDKSAFYNMCLPQRPREF